MAARRSTNDMRKRQDAAPQAGGAHLPHDTGDANKHDLDEDEQEPSPTVGKTGRAGSRAERPAEGGSDRRQGKKPADSSHVHKPPAETPKSEDASGAARRHGG